MRSFEFIGNDHQEVLARELAAHPDYRILRRLPRIEEMWLAPTLGPAHTTIAVLDTETTGLDPDRDKLIELAIVKMVLDCDGRLADITRPMTFLEDPGIAIPPHIQEITGIDDTMVIGQRIDTRLVEIELDDADCLVSHNAKFDRGFMLRRFPNLRHPWACTAADLNWRAMGLEGRALGHLLASAGHHHDAHRAGPDTWALACLLAMAAPDERTVAAALVENAHRTTWRVYASGAPFSCKDELRVMGYRWDAKRRAWWIDVEPEAVGEVDATLREMHPFIRPQVEPIDWYNRHNG